jgi:hypothetical protein
MNIFSQQIEKMKLSENEITKEYRITENNQSKSIQASTLFKNPEMYEMIYGKIKSKEIQNFENAKDSGSIMYLEFEKNFESESFIKGLIWGKNKKPTNENPEEIFVKENILIIWSFEENSELKKLSKKKIELEMK